LFGPKPFALIEALAEMVKLLEMLSDREGARIDEFEDKTNVP
jgi:hypothetical protein